MTTLNGILLGKNNGQPRRDMPCPEMVDRDTETLDRLQGLGRSAGIEKCLPQKSLLNLVGDHRGERITCLNGSMWITQPGKVEDIFLYAGESFKITQKGAILIEGLVESRVKIDA